MPGIDTWLHQLNTAADEDSTTTPARAMIFRQVLHAAFEAGRQQGYREGAADLMATQWRNRTEQT